MKIGIISAMKEEIQAILNVLEVRKKSTKGMRTYFEGTLFGKEVVIVFSRWGKVASATTVTQLLNDFKIQEIIFTGVAGAIQPEVSIGDIIIGEELYQHDLDGSPLVDTYEVPLLGLRSFTTNHENRIKLKRACEDFFDHIHNYLDHDKLVQFKISKPNIHIGAIASGDQFISRKEQISSILSGLPQVKCVEMEGAAVAQVCYEYNIPYSIIRTISDNANQNAHVDFPKFAHEVASIYARAVLENYLKV
ncbi:5'-methylthioadenosine/adenosylhomocysteine nucleosidase [Lutimonas zeaxanthinifaciens]|uniref:5'-methylthioadenosine/adenosylhomocysteine nucleosidase n=1 Tax=Lutimonas zeaxanthinifaciens TaxID=3060215 RepID=UPI00265CF3B9|nr:5'-methylthioadenosine/adenosylhomocysteine nucleosidase [Lutimonas sp. YSD2104]WKK64727.1 5'-methylthioadenosine/adenosylhomocysteine nucleosidase [Lutimonas sp. YSD2104]